MSVGLDLDSVLCVCLRFAFCAFFWFSLDYFVVVLLHFARVVDDAKCIVVTRVCVSVCVSVCLSVRGRTPILLHGPGCNLGRVRGCP